MHLAIKAVNMMWLTYIIISNEKKKKQKLKSQKIASESSILFCLE